MLADFVGQLGGKRSTPDPGGVGLGDAEHVVEIEGADAGAGGRRRGSGVGRGDVRIGAMIDVQQHALRTLEKHRTLRVHPLVQQRRDVRHQPAEHLPQRPAFVQHLRVIHWRGAKIVLQREIMIIHDFLQPGVEDLRADQFSEAQTTARNLVFIGGSDAPPGGTDGRLAAGLFTGGVQCDVIRQYYGTGFTDAQTLADVDIPCLQAPNLLPQGSGRQHYAVTDQALNILAQDA
jgi:hypothetical protein